MSVRPAPFFNLLRVTQQFDGSHVADPAAEVTQELTALRLADKVKPRETIAITAGSRGIANIAEITKAIVDHVKVLGCQPIIVPAMGSHGGATAAGQVAILEKLGITETSCGCSIRSSMETVEVCRSKLGFPVFIDREAMQCDHIIIANRIKAHTSIAGDLESGLVKMMLIGLGKHQGAKIYHQAMADYSFAEIAAGIAADVIDRGKVLAAVGLVENGYDQTAAVEAFLPGEMIAGEKRLLNLSKRLMPRLPFDDIDLLLVDRIGKNISGTGIDTNVVGRKSNDNVAMGNEVPRVKRIMVRSLTPESRGNANGIGMAEFCHSRILDGIDLEAMRTNAITALHPTAARIPISFATDRAMIEAAASTVGLTPLAQQKFVWIRDTLHLSEFYCSEAYEKLVASDARLRIVTREEMIFDEDANLGWKF